MLKLAFENYKLLEKIVKRFDFDYLKLKSDGFMDLVIEKLNEDGNVKIISLAHYYEQNGDLIPDPDIVVRVNTDFETAEVLEYQDTHGYVRIYSSDNKYINLKARRNLNSFLNFFLKQKLKQGFKNV